MVAYQPTPWEEELTDRGSSHRSLEDVAGPNEAGL